MGVRAREGPRPRVGRRPEPVGLVGRMLWVSALLLLVCAIARFSASSVAVGNETALSTAEMKNRGACALTRAGGSFYTIKLKSACRKPPADLSLSGLDPVPLSKIGTLLLAS